MSGVYGTERTRAFGGVEYVYDGDGQRVKKSSGRLYWGAGPLAESDANGTLVAEYVFVNGQRAMRRDVSTGAMHYYFLDHLGSATVVANSSGTVENESDYLPFGEENAFQNATEQHFKFTGKERDTETGLDYFGARYYASTMGRFLSPDWSAKEEPVPYAKLDNPQTLNLYAYVGNNPLIHIDADGHDSLGLSFDNYRAEVHGYHIPMTGHGRVAQVREIETTDGWPVQARRWLERGSSLMSLENSSDTVLKVPWGLNRFHESGQTPRAGSIRRAAWSTFTTATVSG